MRNSPFNAWSVMGRSGSRRERDDGAGQVRAMAHARARTFQQLASLAFCAGCIKCPAPRIVAQVQAGTTIKGVRAARVLMMAMWRRSESDADAYQDRQ